MVSTIKQAGIYYPKTQTQHACMETNQILWDMIR